MYRSYCYVEICVLLILYYAGWNFPSKNLLRCSRLKSRLVRMIIHKKVLPVLHRYRLQLPLDCPFHSIQDVFWWPDVRTDFIDGQWLCPFCGEVFGSEEAVIKHWDAEHMHQQHESSICLANFCDIFRCDVILSALEAEKNKLIWDKFPNFPNSYNKSSCDHKKMVRLQKKCKGIMGQCLLSLFPVLSVQDFHDVEDEVNQAVCSYLTCNKYTDSSLQVIQPVPLLVSFILCFFLLGGFCLCYYVVYALSYPLPVLNNEPLCNGYAIRPRPHRDIPSSLGAVHNRKKILRYHART